MSYWNGKMENFKEERFTDNLALFKNFSVCGNPQFIGKLAEICLFCKAEYIRLMYMSLWYCCEYHGQYCSEVFEFTNREDSILGLNAYECFLFSQFHNFSFFTYPSYLFFLYHYYLDSLFREGKKRSSDWTRPHSCYC